MKSTSISLTYIPLFNYYRIVFPGGHNSITNTSGYGAAGQILYDLVLKSDHHLPLWGTCLGFEMLMYLAANQTWPMDLCAAKNRADPLILKPGKKNHGRVKCFINSY